MQERNLAQQSCTRIWNNVQCTLSTGLCLGVERNWKKVTISCVKDTVGKNAEQKPANLRFILGGKYIYSSFISKCFMKNKITFLSDLNLLTQPWAKQWRVLPTVSRIQWYVWYKHSFLWMRDWVLAWLVGIGSEKMKLKSWEGKPLVGCFEGLVLCGTCGPDMWKALRKKCLTRERGQTVLA